MASDKRDFSKELDENDSTWFRESYRYEGIGRASFEDPYGIVEGPTWVEFDHQGKSRGEMIVERTWSNEPLPLGVFGLWHGGKPEPGQEPNSLSLSVKVDTEFNRCARLEIMHGNTLFQAIAPIYVSHSFSMHRAQPTSTKLGFQLFEGVFNVREAKPFYWTMPLVNFLSRYPTGSIRMDDHVMRLRKVTRPPESGLDMEFVAEWSRFRKYNGLIEFEHSGRPSYIEPLLDYVAREESLKTGSSRRLATAVMVGELPDGIHTEEGVKEHLGPEIELILSLITGSDVRIPWIELYDKEGSLIARLHSSNGIANCSRGHRIIDELWHRGTGPLLTSALSSEFVKTAAFAVTCKHIVRGGLRSLTVDDSLTYFVRALDGLCEQLGAKTAFSLLDMLTDDESNILRRKLDEAASYVRRMGREAKQDHREDVGNLLEKTAGRIQSSHRFQSAFGEAVTRLLAMEGLHDLEVVTKYLASNPRGDKKKWLEIVSYYRALVLHSGYIETEGKPDDFAGAIQIMHHLHDILLRIVLRRLKYDGTYAPPTIGESAQNTLDWVTPETAPKWLGYE